MRFRPGWREQSLQKSGQCSAEFIWLRLGNTLVVAIPRPHASRIETLWSRFGDACLDYGQTATQASSDRSNPRAAASAWSSFQVPQSSFRP